MLIADPVARETAILAAGATSSKCSTTWPTTSKRPSTSTRCRSPRPASRCASRRVQSSDPPDIPQNPRLRRTGIGGEAQYITEASDRSRGYEVQTAPSVDGPWTPYDVFSSTRHMVLKGFERAKDLWVRSRAIGPNNTKSGWSNPVSILIE